MGLKQRLLLFPLIGMLLGMAGGAVYISCAPTPAKCDNWVCVGPCAGPGTCPGYGCVCVGASTGQGHCVSE